MRSKGSSGTLRYPHHVVQATLNIRHGARGREQAAELDGVGGPGRADDGRSGQGRRRSQEAASREFDHRSRLVP